MSNSFVMTPAAARDYLRALDARQAKAKQEGQIDNSRLYAGSPMYYYCKLCELIAEVLSEGHLRAPRRYCSACQEMIDRGYSPSLGKFPGIDVPEEVIVEAVTVEQLPAPAAAQLEAPAAVEKATG